MDTGSLALAIHMPSHQMVVCVHTLEMSQPNAPHSLQITATDNKQLFACWMRVGDETKVFLSVQQMCCRANADFTQSSNIKKTYLMYSNFLSFHWCDLLDSWNLGHSYSEVNLIKYSETLRNIFKRSAIVFLKYQSIHKGLICNGNAFNDFAGFT